jgi:hypothetical protein
MNLSGLVLRNLVFVLIVFAISTRGSNLGQTQMPPSQSAVQAVPAAGAAQAPSICGNQPLCYETADFAAVVTDFRTSKSGYFGLIATTIRFVNKTSNPLVLGYANGSGTAQDDSGLRYGVGGANGLRGMGLVNGPYVDPKFVLQPGGFGDARFELATRLTPVYGITFALNLTVNEINTLEGNQHTVGAEFPLEFQGLTNGARGTAPGAVIPSANGVTGSGANGLLAGVGSAAPACGPAGTANAIAGATNSAAAQNAANTASSTASNAASAVSSITSLFGKKKKPVDATNTAAAVPCVPATATAAATVSAVPVAAAAVAQSKGTVAAPISGTVPAATPTPTGTTTPTPAGAAKAATPAPTATNTATGAAKATLVNPPKSPAPAAKPPVKKPASATPPAEKPAQAQP